MDRQLEFKAAIMTLEIIVVYYFIVEIKTMFGSSLPLVVCRRAHVLFTLHVLFAHSGVQHISCCVFVLLFHRLVYRMLPVSLDCPLLIAFSILWIVHC